jgi:hypothetical protein
MARIARKVNELGQNPEFMDTFTLFTVMTVTVVAMLG